MNIEALLTHADFVRSLARSLVIDEHRAADIEQETWLAALNRPPSKEKPPRAWLALVIRNFARIMYRDEARRKKHERSAASRTNVSPAGKVCSTEEMAAKLEMRRSLIEMVLQLDEPYRTAVMLRFYENLPPREMAQRLGLPIETVRTRVKRGIEQLKTRLDTKYKGGRKAWCLTLAPLAGMNLKGARAATAFTTTAAPAGAAAIPGALLLTAKAKVFIATALIIVSAITLWYIVPQSPEDPVPPPILVQEEGSKEEHEKPPFPDAQNIGYPASAIAAIARERIPPSGDRNPPGDKNPTGSVVSGVVIDEATGRPARQKDIRIAISLDIFGIKGSPRNSMVEPEEGTFRFQGVAPGKYDMVVQGPGYRQKIYLDLVEVKEGVDINDLRFTIPPMGELRLQFTGFTDEELDALSILFLPEQGRDYSRTFRDIEREVRCLFEAGRMGIRIESGALGMMDRVVNIDPGQVQELAISRNEFDQDSNGSAILSGTFQRVDGSPLSGALVQFKYPRVTGSNMNRPGYQAFTDQDGRFSLENFEGGCWDIQCILLKPGDASRISDGKLSRFASYLKGISRVTFHNRVISVVSPKRYSLDLVLPAGTVRGTLFDNFLNQPVDDKTAFWRAGLCGSSGHKQFREILNGSGNHIELAEGGILDLGAIHLKPSGAVELEVVDIEENPLQYFGVTWHCKHDFSTDINNRRLTPGRRLYWELPVGTIKLVVSAKGYREQEMTVTLKPARIEKVRAILQPEG